MAAHRSWIPCSRSKSRVRPAVEVNHFAEGEPAMLATRFTELVGCSVPIQQAGMGAVAPPELAAAVSEAGGLGMLGTARPGGHSVKGLSSLLDRLTALTARPFGVNFIVSPLGLPDAPHRCLRSCVTAAEAFHGDVVGETPHIDGTRVAVRRFDCLA